MPIGIGIGVVGESIGRWDCKENGNDCKEKVTGINFENFAKYIFWVGCLFSDGGCFEKWGVICAR